MITTFRNYWLNQWIDEFGIHSRAEYDERIKSPTVVRRLYELVASQTWKKTTSTDAPAGTVLAGNRLDLSSRLSCTCAPCTMIQLEELVRRTFHFFDSITVAGPSADVIEYRLGSGSKNERRKLFDELRGIVMVMGRIRLIEGLPEKVYFAVKPGMFCESCKRMHAGRAGIDTIYDPDQSRQVIDQLKREAKFSSRRDRSGAWVTSVDHPMIHGGWSGRYDKSGPQGRIARPSPEKIATDIFHEISDPVVYDAAAATHYRLPLVDEYQVSWLRPSVTREVTQEQVALEIELPILLGADLELLLRAQKDKPAEHLRFQAAVRAAIDEKIKDGGSSDPKRLAEKVRLDYIEPELAKIRSTLESSQRSFGRKLAAAGSIGTTVTTIGLLGSMPLIVATGVGAAATAVTQLYKYFDDRASVESADLYFLCAIEKRARH